MNSIKTDIKQQRKTLAELNHKNNNAAIKKQYHFLKLQLMQDAQGIQRMKMGRTQTTVSSLPSTHRNTSKADYLKEIQEANKEKLPGKPSNTQHHKSRSTGFPNLSMITNSQYVPPLNEMNHVSQFNSGVVCIGRHIDQNRVDFVPPVASHSPKLSTIAKTVTTQPTPSATNESVQPNIQEIVLPNPTKARTICLKTNTPKLANDPAAEAIDIHSGTNDVTVEALPQGDIPQPVGSMGESERHSLVLNFEPKF